MSIVLKAERLQKLSVAFRNALYQNGLPSLLIGVRETALTEERHFLSAQEFP